MTYAFIVTPGYAIAYLLIYYIFTIGNKVVKANRKEVYDHKTTEGKRKIIQVGLIGATVASTACFIAFLKDGTPLFASIVLSFVAGGFSGPILAITPFWLLRVK